eukprot:tig00020563_g11279.t1
MRIEGLASTRSYVDWRRSLARQRDAQRGVLSPLSPAADVGTATSVPRFPHPLVCFAMDDVGLVPPLSSPASPMHSPSAAAAAAPAPPADPSDSEEDGARRRLSFEGLPPRRAAGGLGARAVSSPAAGAGSGPAAAALDLEDVAVGFEGEKEASIPAPDPPTPPATPAAAAAAAAPQEAPQAAPAQDPVSSSSSSSSSAASSTDPSGSGSEAPAAAATASKRRVGFRLELPGPNESLASRVPLAVGPARLARSASEPCLVCFVDPEPEPDPAAEPGAAEPPLPPLPPLSPGSPTVLPLDGAEQQQQQRGRTHLRVSLDTAFAGRFFGVGGVGGVGSARSRRGRLLLPAGPSASWLEWGPLSASASTSASASASVSASAAAAAIAERLESAASFVDMDLLDAAGGARVDSRDAGEGEGRGGGGGGGGDPAGTRPGSASDAGGDRAPRGSMSLAATPVPKAPPAFSSSAPIQPSAALAARRRRNVPSALGRMLAVVVTAGFDRRPEEARASSASASGPAGPAADEVPDGDWPPRVFGRASLVPWRAGCHPLPLFERAVLLCILGSCVVLAVDNPSLTGPAATAIRALDAIFTAAFAAEVLVRSLESGLVIVMSVAKAVPYIFRVSLLIWMFWGFFATLGVQLFMGRYGYCNDGSIQFRDDCSGSFLDPSTRTEQQRRWLVHHANFDNVLNALLTCFEVVLNWYIAVVVSAFSRAREQMSLAAASQGYDADALSHDQKQWAEVLQYATSTGIRPRMRKPRAQWRRRLYRLVRKSWARKASARTAFEPAIVVMIALNVALLVADHYGGTPAWNHTFVAFFLDAWRRSDFVIVVVCSAGALLDLALLYAGAAGDDSNLGVRPI